MDYKFAASTSPASSYYQCHSGSNQWSRGFEWI